MDGKSSISPQELYAVIGTASAPTVIDARRDAAFDADDRMLVSARRLPSEDIGIWTRDLPADRPVVVYCVHGHEASQQATAAIRGAGIDARSLEGGITGWAELGLPLRKKIADAPGGWVTRERPKIDRIACPWLIRRFIDPKARFLFVPTEMVFEVAATAGATAPVPNRSRTMESCAALTHFCGFTRSAMPRSTPSPSSSGVPIRRGWTWPRKPRASSQCRSGFRQISRTTRRCSSTG